MDKVDPHRFSNAETLMEAFTRLSFARQLV